MNNNDDKNNGKIGQYRIVHWGGVARSKSEDFAILLMAVLAWAADGCIVYQGCIIVQLSYFTLNLLFTIAIIHLNSI